MNKYKNKYEKNINIYIHANLLYGRICTKGMRWRQ